jgi:hypothetical protein
VPVLRDYVTRGGTLVVNIAVAKGLPVELLGLRPTGSSIVSESWTPEGGRLQPTTPYEVAAVEVAGAKALAWATDKAPLITRHAVGAGAVVVTLCPRMLGQDERAHPALPYLMNGLTADLMPLEVRLAGGARPSGQIMHQVNRTKDGWLVTLVNNQGVDKTQHGIARVDRRQFVDVVLRTKLPVKAAKEYTEPRDLTVAQGAGGPEIAVRVHPGDVQVIALTTR